MTSQTKAMLTRLLTATLFSIAFAYIESAVVVYLRVIFQPKGISFPLQIFDLTGHGRRLLMTEVGREVATLVLILTGAWLFGHSRRERIAYVLVIFAVWDIFYYVWLKVLLNWPATLMDWDVLFLMPVVWVSPVLYPILVSCAMFAFAVVILYRCAHNLPLAVTSLDWVGWLVGTAVITVSFCLGGTHAAEADYAKHFHPALFAVGYAVSIAASVRSLRGSGAAR